jgi:peptide/nickel transport system permease protein
MAWIGIGLLLLIILIAVFAPLLAPYDPLQQNIAYRLEPPSAEFWLGTDSYGRDVLSRLIYGARVSLLVGFVAVMIAMTIGSALGVLAGYVGGVLDRLIMGLVDVLLSFPTLLLGLMVAAMLGASLENLIIAIAITEIAPFVRVARAPTIVLKQRDFVEAGRSLGYGPMRLMGIHILPNMISEVVVLGALWMATAIRTEASLSFIGLGAPPPTPTWGSMIREGFENILDAWWLTVCPSIAILVTVLALSLLGDALRDAIDPKTRSERS